MESEDRLEKASVHYLAEVDTPSSFKSRLIDACVSFGPSAEIRKTKTPHDCPRYLMVEKERTKGTWKEMMGGKMKAFSRC